MFKSFFNRLFSRPCPECKEVRVMYWHSCCDFCEPGDGQVKN
jgi:hypothetical protein